MMSAISPPWGRRFSTAQHRNQCRIAGRAVSGDLSLAEAGERNVQSPHYTTLRVSGLSIIHPNVQSEFRAACTGSGERTLRYSSESVARTSRICNFLAKKRPYRWLLNPNP
jgi:hypothetical protein